MAKQLYLHVCSQLEREVRALSSHPDFQNVQIVPHPVECDLYEAKWPGLEKAIADSQSKGNSVGFLGSFCLTQALGAVGSRDACLSWRRNTCFEWLADRDILDRYLQDGAFFLVPGWLKNWESLVSGRWGSDRKSAQSFFKSAARKLVLLDTGLYPNAEGSLAAFSKFVRLPGEVFPVGLGYFRLSLNRLAMDWKRDVEHVEAENRIEVIRRRVAGFSQFGGLLGRVNKARTEDDVLSSVSEILDSLLSPRDTRFHAADSLSHDQRNEDSPLDRILSLNADYAWSEDRSGLYLKVAAGREIFGIFEVSGLALDDSREQALGIGMTAAGVAGLALACVRSSQSLREEREKSQSVEAALKVSEEKVRSVIESVPVGIYRTTTSGQIIDANPTLAKMLGYPDVAALKAVNTQELHLNAADRDLWKSLLEGGGFVENFETQLRRLDGTIIWVKDTARAVKDNRGNSLFFDGTLEDITKRKQTESSLSWNYRMRAAIAELSSRLLSPTTIEEMSALVLEHARRLTASRTGFVGYMDEKTERLVSAGLTTDAKKLLEGHPDVAATAHQSSGLWDWVLKNKKPILTNVPSLDPRFSGMPEWHFSVTQFLSAPAVMSGSLVGLISLANSERMYSEQDLEAVERLAELYAIAVHRARTEEQLREMSLVDDLTRLYNRRGFLTLAEQQLKIANRAKKELSLLYADLDDLKIINDTYGHQEGDRALVDTAAILKDVFRESDIIARIGGDEFVVLALDMHAGNSETLVKRMRENIDAYNGANGRKFSLSLSLGVAWYNPGTPCSVLDLLAIADGLMYEEKTRKKLQPVAG